MTPLSDLHRRLARLRRARDRFRSATAYSAVATAVLAALAVAFPIDWYFQRNMDVAQRLFLLALCVGVAVWAFRRFAKPWLHQRETELDMALLVEREEHVDSDLVAALEFEWPEAPSWGSVQLEQAVIEQVAAEGQRFNVMRNLPRRELGRRTRLLGVAAALWIVLIALAPGHVAVFLRRLLLSPEHYPTRARIEAIAVGGRRIDPADWGRKPIRLRYGQPARFEIRGSTVKGALPGEATAELSARKGGAHASIALVPVDNEEGVFSGELPELVEPVRCQLYFGDAWTDPGDLTCTQLPAVELQAEVVPPAYAGPSGDHPAAIPRGMRQFSVMEGSEVRIRVRTDKPVHEVVLSLDDRPFQFVRDASSGARAELWVAGDEETPLACVVQPIRYAVQVTDLEEQKLDRPIEGVVRIQPDLPPRVTAKTRTPFIVPAAAPKIYLGAVDDHALGRIWMSCEITRGKEGAGGDAGRPVEIPVYDLAAGELPPRDITAEPALEFARLGVVKGDTVKVTVWARGFRGKLEGKSAAAEPLV
ncbi:MAG: hypothetical protein ABR915_14125, partial [Thermoguttaceae bacterium]